MQSSPPRNSVPRILHPSNSCKELLTEELNADSPRRVIARRDFLKFTLSTCRAIIAAMPSAFPMLKLHGAQTRSQPLSRVGFGVSTFGFIRSRGRMGCLRSTRVRFGRADLPGALVGGIIGMFLGDKLLI